MAEGEEEKESQTHEQRAWHEVVIVRLVKEHVLPVLLVVARRCRSGGEGLQRAVGGDAVLQSEPLPKLKADLVAGGDGRKEG